VVLTPFEGMQMQLQVDQRTKKEQAALVMAGAIGNRGRPVRCTGPHFDGGRHPQ
jgi:hypothetical protein